MKNMKSTKALKRSILLLLIILWVFASYPAFATEQKPAQWINSTVLGSVTADTETSPREDFHVWANKEWILNAKIAEGQTYVSLATQHRDEVRKDILALLKDTSLTSFEAQLAQRLFSDYMDMDTRNALGMEPVMPYIEEIQRIQTLDDLSAYLQLQDRPFTNITDIGVSADLKDSENTAVYIDNHTFTLNDADEYRTLTPVGERRKRALTTVLEKLLPRVGYTATETTGIIDQLFQIETQIASATKGSSETSKPDYIQTIYNPYTTDELAALATAYPLVEVLKPYTDVGVDRFILMQPEWFIKLNELYTQENVEAFKALLLGKTLLLTTRYLDQECRDIQDEMSSINAGMEINSVLEDDAISVCSTYLDMPVGKMYCDAYVQEQTKEDIKAMIADVVAVYRNRLENNEWMGEETRQKALEKLEALKVRAAYPDDWSLYDFSDVVFKTKEEGGNLLEDMLAIGRHTINEQIKNATQPINREKWRVSPQTVNAFYNLRDNSINIIAGILGGELYSADASYEYNLGKIGMIIGHEITHAFDSRGSQYDKDGNLINWWTDEDRAAFTALTDKVNTYFSAIEALPGVYVDGTLTIGEAVADLGAISCMLEMARSHESFDYDTFFTSYAGFWASQMPAEVAETFLRTDAHAPDYLRTNVTLQQFQEFYDTYGVVEGDGMYLAPESRLKVW